MDRKSLLNQIELAYAPITAYEFAIIKDDPIIEDALVRASLYAIAQRPVITFENVLRCGADVYFLQSQENWKNFDHECAEGVSEDARFFIFVHY